MGRTNIELNDALVKKALKLTGASTKKALVHQALESLIRQESLKKILKYEGKVQWEGDLSQMRKSRHGAR